MLYIGMDVHSKMSTYEAIDPVSGEMHREHRVLNEEVVSKVGALPSPKRVIIEAGRTSWVWYQRLSEVAEEVWIVSPHRVREQLKGQAKTDRRDARALARLTIEGRLAPIWVPDAACITLRALTRARLRLVRQSTATKNALRALGAQFGYECPYKDVMGKSATTFWEELVALPEEALCIKQLCRDQLTALHSKIEQLEQRIQERIKDHAVARLLRTVPGVGPLTAATLVAEIGDIARFDHADALIKYAGMDPSVYQSANTLRHGPISKQKGNRYLRTAAIWAAQKQAQVKTDSKLRRNYWRLRLSQKHHPNVAKLDTARDILKVVYYLWKKGEPYRSS